MEGALRIGELAERAHVSIDAIRYYERRGLLPSAPRTPGGYRVFTDETIKRVLFIKQAQELGFSLDDIKDLMTSGGADECVRVRDLLMDKISEVEGRIRRMREFRQALARHLNACNNELNEKGKEAHCPVLFEIELVPKGEKRK